MSDQEGKTSDQETMTRPHFGLAIIPVIVLLLLLFLNIQIFKDDTISGSNQMALLFSAFVAVTIGVFVYKTKYVDIEKQMIRSIKMALQASLILLIVGSIIGIWILSGIVPSMVYYGLKLLNPTVFLPVACLICMIVSSSTGSSWSTTGTVGIALMGIGKALGIPDGMTAGAIISGSYFGDKMSPLSDTTNLAPAMAGTDVFTHIRHMFYTTTPSIILALIGFTLVGIFSQKGGQGTAKEVAEFMEVMEKTFHIHLALFLVPVIVIVLVIKKISAIPALLVGLLLGGVAALLFQSQLLARLIGGETSGQSLYKQLMAVAYAGFKLESGNQLMDSLFNRGGMYSMLKTVWLIIMAMVFGGAMEGTGMLQVIAGKILSLVKNAGSLVAATLGSCIIMNMIACDQYISIVLPGRMFKNAYDQYKLHPKNLSRALEDAGTLTSVLFPWNSCGAYNSGVLGVPTLTYLPFCFFNLLNPLVAFFYAGFGITIEKWKEGEGNNTLDASQGE